MEIKREGNRGLEGLGRDGEVDHQSSNGGMGDMMVTLKRLFYRNDSLQGGIQAAFIAGSNFPPELIRTVTPKAICCHPDYNWEVDRSMFRWE